MQLSKNRDSKLYLFRNTIGPSLFAGGAKDLLESVEKKKRNLLREPSRYVVRRTATGSDG